MQTNLRCTNQEKPIFETKTKYEKENENENENNKGGGFVVRDKTCLLIFRDLLSTGSATEIFQGGQTQQRCEVDTNN
jgi:hypothetical protein